MGGAHRSTKVRAPWWLVVLLVAWAAGCDADDPCRALAEGAAPHQEVFSRFATVATRVSASDSAFADRAHFEESLFVSLRGEPTVLAAWVERTGAAPLALAYPPRAPALDATFATCRLPSGRLEAARGMLQIGTSPGPAYFLRQRIDDAPQTLVITVAFVDDAPR